MIPAIEYFFDHRQELPHPKAKEISLLLGAASVVTGISGIILGCTTLSAWSAGYILIGGFPFTATLLLTATALDAYNVSENINKMLLDKSFWELSDKDFEEKITCGTSPIAKFIVHILMEQPLNNQKEGVPNVPPRYSQGPNR